MNTEIIEKINQEVFSRFPYLKSCVPVISTNEDGNTLLIYSGIVKTENDFPLPITIRINADRSGKIIKITTSR